MKNKKQIIIVGIVIMIIGLIGITYAAYTYFRLGTSNNKLISGDIYMRYKETTGLTLSNATPSSNYIANNYFEFQIIGKNTTTNKDIYYEILLDHGAVPTGKTESNRIDDKFIKFRLVSVLNNNETEIFANRSYSNINNTRIHVQTIPKNTSNEITHTYRLYMWIGSDVAIGNTNDADYTISEWNNLFASIKVNSNGDFIEKEMEIPSPEPTPESCFTTAIEDLYTLNSPLSSSALNACVEFFSVNYDSYFEDENQIIDYCNGSGPDYNDDYFQAGIDGTIYDYSDSRFYDEEIEYFLENDIISSEEVVSITGYDEVTCGTDVVIPSTINSLNVKIISSDSFVSKEITSVYFPSSVNIIGQGAFYDNNLTNLVIPSTIRYIAQAGFDENAIENLTMYSWHNLYKGDGYITFKLVENANVYVHAPKILADAGDNYGPSDFNLILGNEVTTIADNAFYGYQLKSVIIPSSVTSIGGNAFTYSIIENLTLNVNDLGIFQDGLYSRYFTVESLTINNASTIPEELFKNYNIENLTLGNSVTTIGNEAFADNQLTSITLGNSVTTIGNEAFADNQLTTVTIGTGITSIGENVFYGNSNLTSITIDKSCNYIKNNIVYTDDYDTYNWISFNGYPSGITIYGSGNTVCDTL